MSRHLGDLAAAFVDEQLDAHDRARVLRHLSACARCAAEVEAQRQVKKRLGGLRPPAVPAVLAARLLNVPNTQHVPEDTLPGDTDPAGEGAAGAGAAGVSHTVATAAPASARPSAPGERPPPRPSTGGGPPGKPGGAGSRARTRRRRIRTIVLSSASALVLCMGVFGVAFAVGGAPSGGPPVAPPMPAYVAQHASVSNDVPLSDPALTTVTSMVLP